MPNYKPFPLVSAAHSDGFCASGPNRVKPRPVVVPRAPGLSLRASKSGASAFRHLAVRAEPEKFERKQLSANQLNAAHVKWLEAQGWKRKRIADFLGLKAWFVSNVIHLLAHRLVAAQKPPNFEDQNTANPLPHA